MPQMNVVEAGIPDVVRNLDAMGSLQSGFVSETDGYRLADLDIGTRLEVVTEHRTYSIEIAESGKTWISGHPRYCPRPTEVLLVDSTPAANSGAPGAGGGLGRPALLKRSDFVGRGQRLEFWHAAFDLVTTSRITEIRRITPQRSPASDSSK